MKLHVSLPENPYDIFLESGAIERAGEFFNLSRKVFIVTDSGVPMEYSKSVLAAAKEGTVFSFPAGEASKNIETWKSILSAMADFGMSRKDCVVAVGGGVVGDMAGFAAATYMRGIDFYNVPTTLLSQVDSSVGGKVAVDLDGFKNLVGAFYQPSGVLVDPALLETLPERELNAGLAEALKMGLTSDEELYSLFRENRAKEELSTVIMLALKVKITVVEEDPTEQGLRRVLNFGHTLGHAIETACGLGRLLHGECVALGMIPMTQEPLRDELIGILRSLGLPTVYTGDRHSLLSAVMRDKKGGNSAITTVRVSTPGQFCFVHLPKAEIENYVREGLEILKGSVE